MPIAISVSRASVRLVTALALAGSAFAAFAAEPEAVDTSTTKLKPNEALTDFSIDYGLQGKPGYSYTRPFDYFNLQATASSANGFENLMTRGMLKGRAYDAGANISSAPWQRSIAADTTISCASTPPLRSASTAVTPSRSSIWATAAMRPSPIRAPGDSRGAPSDSSIPSWVRTGSATLTGADGY